MKNMIYLVLFFPQMIFAQQISSVLQHDLQAGQLSHEEYLAYRALSVYAPEKLPQQYAAAQATSLPLKSATLLISELKANWQKLTAEYQRLLKPHIERPELDSALVSPSGKFRIHYKITGQGAVDPTDDDANGHPDYVDLVAEVFDHVYNYEVEDLEYTAPPADNGIDGAEFDVYIVELYSRLYGQTTPENEVVGKPGTYSSYIEIDNDYKNYPTSGADGLRVTAAHEFFHAIHMGYKFTFDDEFWEKDVFFYEISSTWMEDVVYDEINDYYFYMNSFFNNINKPFDTYDGSYEYGNCLWNHMLTKKYGTVCIRRIWENMPQYSAIAAIDRVLASYQSNFTQELTSYSIWNYFTGERADTVDFYSEGKHYPQANFKIDHIFNADTTLTAQSSQLAYSYCKVYEPEFQNSAVFIPLNYESNDNLRKDFTIRLKKTEADSFKSLAEDFYILFKVDDQFSWQTNIIHENANGDITILNYNEINGSQEYKDKIIGFGPNPLIWDQDQEFNIFYSLEQASWVEITIYAESGKLIRSFKETMRARGDNKFTWYLEQRDGARISSGIYVCVFRTEKTKKMFKFAVIK